MRKYRINEILAKMPPQVATAKRLILKKELRMSAVRLSNYVHVKRSQTLDFNGLDLPLIAQILEVEMSELFNQEALKEVRANE